MTASKLNNKLQSRIDHISARKGKTVEVLAVKVLRDYVDAEESLEIRNKLADEAWEEVQKTRLAISNDKMIEWFDALLKDKAAPCPPLENF